ncbi:MAG: XTP/dITP diphosphatase [Anaerolineae bacterium]|nr:MAG: XTP/dITP diphosphatase [Anaerolineae bacterium]
MSKRLLLATKNPGKLKEYAELFIELDLEWLNLDEMGINLDVEESGETFKENAIIKATSYAKASGCLTMADDSGLEVDALNGRPGVRTARFGGPHLSAEERYRHLLTLMERIPENQRSARFKCVIALALPGGLVGISQGICEGAIANSPRGSGGFGYDPIFYLPTIGKTMAELTSNEKHRVSHRGLAVANIKPILEPLLSETNKNIT